MDPDVTEDRNSEKLCPDVGSDAVSKGLSDFMVFVIFSLWFHTTKNDKISTVLQLFCVELIFMCLIIQREASIKTLLRVRL